MQQENLQPEIDSIKTQDQKSIILPIIITVLITLIIVGLASYFIFSSIYNSKIKELENKIQFLEDAIQTKKSGLEDQYSKIANWNIFENEEIGFSFKYPIDWQVEDVGITDYLISYIKSEKDYNGRPLESFVFSYGQGDDVYNYIKDSGTEIEKINLQHGLDGYKYKGFNNDILISFTQGDYIYTISMLNNLSDDYFEMMRDVLYTFKILD